MNAATTLKPARGHCLALLLVACGLALMGCSGASSEKESSAPASTAAPQAPSARPAAAPSAQREAPSFQTTWAQSAPGASPASANPAQEDAALTAAMQAILQAPAELPKAHRAAMLSQLSQASRVLDQALAQRGLPPQAGARIEAMLREPGALAAHEAFMAQLYRAPELPAAPSVPHEVAAQGSGLR